MRRAIFSITMSEQHDTREQWLESAADYLYTDFIGELGRLPKKTGYQISCGWPSSRSQSIKNRRLGECWYPTACADKETHHIFISPLLSDPIEVLSVLLHELIHPICGVDVGHKGAFKRIALAVGLEGKMTSTHAGKELTRRLNALAKKLGEYPHAALKGTSRKKKQSTRLIKLVAESCCAYVARTTRKWIDEEGLPSCPHGMEMIEVS